MTWETWKKRLGLEFRTHAGRFVAPNIALDLEPGYVAAAHLNLSKRLVQGVALCELPDGLLAPSPNRTNVTDMAVLRGAIGDASKRLGNGHGKVGLLLPDVSARVALLQFETLPENRGQAEDLVRWKMREYLPYPPEEARLSFQVVGTQPGSVEVLGVAVRLSVLAEYEALLEGMNGGAVLVLPATVAMLPLLPEDAAGQLLLHLCPGSLTAVVVADNRIRYWRTRALEGGAAGNLEEVGRETTRLLATCQDNLKVQVQNVWYCGRTLADSSPEVELTLKQILGRELRSLPASFLPPAGLPAGQRETYDRIGMPFAGLLANLN